MQTASTTTTPTATNDYVVIKHSLRDMNGYILGAKFRGGYTVVIKNSKIYNGLKKLPFIKGQQDLSVLILRDLPFITKTSDISLIFGKAVYNKYLEEIKKLEDQANQQKLEERAVAREAGKICKQTKNDGQFCTHESFTPSGYCKYHIFEDPNIEELTGYRIPTRLAKDEIKEWRKKLINKIEKIKS